MTQKINPESLRRLATVFVWLAGILGCLLGLLVIIGWHLRIPELVQINRAFAPMQYNTALGFVLSGGALLASLLRRKLLAVLLGITAAMLGWLTLSQYLWGLDLGIDQLFFNSNVTTRTSHLGRPSPLTALSFGLIGLALIIETESKCNYKCAFSSGLAAVVLALSVTALFGYASGLSASGLWTDYSRIAFHTASGLALVSSGLLVYAWRLESERSHRTPKWLPLPIGIFCLTLTLVFWNTLDNYESRQITETAKNKAEVLGGRLQAELNQHRLGLIRMARRAALFGKPNEQAWRDDAQAYLEDFYGYEAIIWIDTADRLRWVHPDVNNKAVTNSFLIQAEQIQSIAMAARIGQKSFFDRPSTNENHQPRIYIPALIKTDSLADGLIIGVFSLGKILDEIIDPNTSIGFAVAINIGNQTVFSRDFTSDSSKIEVVKDVDLFGTVGELKVYPLSHTMKQLSSPLATITLVLGSLVSILLGGSVHLAQRARESHLEVETLNRDLENRVIQRTSELAEVNELLAISEDLLRRAIATSPIPIMIFDDTGHVLHLSNGWTHCSGYTIDDMPRIGDWERLALKVRTKSQDQTDYDFKDETIKHQKEVIIRNKAGQTRYWDFTFTSLGEGGLGHKLIMSFAVDVTDRREAERLVRESEAKFRNVTETLPQLIWSCLSDGRCDYLGPQWVIYTGIAADKQLNYGWVEQIHPDDRELAQNNWHLAVTSVKSFDVEFRIRRYDGVYRWFKTRATPLRDSNGDIVKWFGTNTDIDDLHQAKSNLRVLNEQLEERVAQRTSELMFANRALRSSEELLREFIIHAPAAIAMLDTQMNYLQASDRWLYDYGLLGKDILGRCHYDIFPEIPERWKTIHQKVLAGAVEKCDEDPFLRVDGRTEWLQWEARPWRKPDDSIGGLIFFTQVITARKELEFQLVQQKEELERSNKELEHFAYVASHDLQEPLRAVSGCAQILQRRYQGKLDHGADELIGHLVDGSKRMQTLITDLLTYSRVATRGHQFQLVNVNLIVDSALLNLSMSIKESGASISLSNLPTIMGDQLQLIQVFQNLIGNALKYRGSNTPKIDISAQQLEHVWRFSVSDNGIGIEPQYYERIFVIFQRLHTRQEYPGTGIGLALCKKIIERHQGRIWVESSSQKGSVFYFTIPCSLKNQGDA